MNTFIQALKLLRKKTHHFKPSTALDQLKDYIQNAENEDDLLYAEKMVDEFVHDQEFNEEEQFELYQQVAQMLALFIFIEDHFPHSYYPPFAIESHIRYAKNHIQLYAIGLHLKINRPTYIAKNVSSTQLKMYENKIKDQLIVTLENQSA